MGIRAIPIARLAVGDRIAYPGPGRGITTTTVTSIVRVAEELATTWLEVAALLGEPLSTRYRASTPRVGTWLVSMDAEPWVGAYIDQHPDLFAVDELF